ncbi:hypothetical protein P691DRAFT_782848 [Macrolepiota fuliginosa MF-IS2]|uniref:Uncharacterized protein n=1 Tax=Macrolepiota fuliginosa MF-IS2 TaxID=1400762 RepID=A0A9P5WWH5_9AGAR|nr:hypothetical protein P691DRAFT_782848 [Macrolepiota fuliginosa MF-IS2]
MATSRYNLRNCLATENNQARLHLPVSVSQDAPVTSESIIPSENKGSRPNEPIGASKGSQPMHEEGDSFFNESTSGHIVTSTPVTNLESYAVSKPQLTAEEIVNIEKVNFIVNVEKNAHGEGSGKGKGIDPLNWGNLGILREEMNMKAQQVAFDELAALKEREANNQQVLYQELVHLKVKETCQKSKKCERKKLSCSKAKKQQLIETENVSTNEDSEIDKSFVKISQPSEPGVSEFIQKAHEGSRKPPYD